MVNVLFCSATPDIEASLDIDTEIREISAGIASNARRDFQIERVGAVRVADLPGKILGRIPDIFHFSGHGSEKGELIFEDEQGDPQLVTNESIRLIFEVLGKGIRCVVLNSCFSGRQANQIAKYVPWVIGNTGEIPDKLSIRFSAAFYQSLSYGKSIPEAFRIAKAMIFSSGKDSNQIIMIDNSKAFKLINPLVFHSPVVKVEFVLNEKTGNPAKSGNLYEMRFKVQHCPPEVQSIHYNLRYGSKDYSHEVFNDGTSLEYEASFYGDLPLRVALWFRDGAVGCVTTIYEALRLNYSTEVMTPAIKKALKYIKEH